MRLRHRTLYTQTCSNGNLKPGPVNAKSALFRNVKRFTESAPRLAGIDTTFDHVRRGALVARYHLRIDNPLGSTRAKFVLDQLMKLRQTHDSTRYPNTRY